jgi:hypothetical protein
MTGHHDWGRGAVVAVECRADDGSPNGQALQGVVSEWASEDLEAQSSMEWEVADDDVSDEDGVFVTVHQFATLLAEANLWRRHVARGCVCGCVPA